MVLNSKVTSLPFELPFKLASPRKEEYGISVLFQDRRNRLQEIGMPLDRIQTPDHADDLMV